MTELEKIILDLIKQGDGRGDLPKLVYYRYLQGLTDRGMSMELAMQSIREERVAEVMESLCAKGYLEKRSNWNGSEMLYFLKQQEPAAQGNYMATVLAKFAAADEEELTETAGESLRIFLKNSGMTDPTRLFQAMLLGANVGFGGTHSLTEKQKKLVNAVFGKAYKGPMEDIYTSICKDIEENTYTILNLFCTVGQDRVGMPLLYYILCFAYIDGKPSQELVNKLEKTFSMPLLMYFMKNAPEDNDPEAEARAQREQEEKARQEAEKKAREEAEKEQRKAEEAAYHSALSEWNKKHDAIIAARAAAVEKQILHARQAKEKKAQEAYEEACRVHQQTIAQQSERRAAAEEALSKLGFFKFAEKKNQQSIATDAAVQVGTAQFALEQAKKQYDDAMAAADRDSRKQKSSIEKKVAEQMPIPEKPKMPAHMVPRDPGQAYYDAILRYMVPGSLYTVSDLLEGVFGFEASMTNQRLSAYLRRMTDNGLVNRVEHNRKAYYMIAE